MFRYIFIKLINLDDCSDINKTFLTIVIDNTSNNKMRRLDLDKVLRL